MLEFLTVSNMEITTNGSVLGDLLSNTYVTMETEDVKMVATSYLMFKIGNFPVVINVAATKWS